MNVPCKFGGPYQEPDKGLDKVIPTVLRIKSILGISLDSQHLEAAQQLERTRLMREIFMVHIVTLSIFFSFGLISPVEEILQLSATDLKEYLVLH